MKTAILAAAIGTIGLGENIQTRYLTSTVCFPADAYTASDIQELTPTLTSSDTLRAMFRQSLHLPLVADTAIQVVSDSTECARALATFNNGRRSPVAGLYLIRAGNTFVASNPAIRGGEFVIHLVMDSSFSALTSFLR
jgi:hypothetical protein